MALAWSSPAKAADDDPRVEQFGKRSLACILADAGIDFFRHDHFDRHPALGRQFEREQDRLIRNEIGVTMRTRRRALKMAATMNS
jgi:hypothetical protein